MFLIANCEAQVLARTRYQQLDKLDSIFDQCVVLRCRRWLVWHEATRTIGIGAKPVYSYLIGARTSVEVHPGLQVGDLGVRSGADFQDTSSPTSVDLLLLIQTLREIGKNPDFLVE